MSLCHSSVGSHSNQTEEVDVTIPVISSWPAPVAIPAEQVGDLPTSGEFCDDAVLLTELGYALLTYCAGICSCWAGIFSSCWAGICSSSSSSCMTGIRSSLDFMIIVIDGSYSTHCTFFCRTKTSCTSKRLSSACIHIDIHMFCAHIHIMRACRFVERPIWTGKSSAEFWTQTESVESLQDGHRLAGSQFQTDGVMEVIECNSDRIDKWG